MPKRTDKALRELGDLSGRHRFGRLLKYFTVQERILVKQQQVIARFFSVGAF